MYLPLPPLSPHIHTDADCQEILYYCDAASDDARLEVHRGNKYGPVIAESHRCSTTPGAIDFVPPRNNRAPSPTHIHHEHRSLKTFFVGPDQHRFHWNRWAELVEDDTDNVVAKLVRNKSVSSNIGKLVIKAGRDFSQDFVDSTVMSALIIQQRDDESSSYF